MGDGGGSCGVVGGMVVVVAMGLWVMGCGSSGYGVVGDGWWW